MEYNMRWRSFGERVHKAKKPGEVISSDVCGPMQTESIDRKLYYVSFKDSWSKFRKIVPISKKSDVAAETKLFLSEAKVQGHIVKSLRSDGGGEYLNTEMECIRREAGFEHLVTMPHTPQQNGAAER